MATPESARRSSSRTLVDAAELEIRSLRVLVLNRFAGEMQELERNRLAVENDLAENVRLSCQIRVNRDLKVHVINQVSVRGIDAGPRPLDE